MDRELALAYCREHMHRSGSSFYYAFFLLPFKQREALMALYTYFRLVDDVVDSELDPVVAAHKLQFWFDETDRLFEGHPTHPATVALKPAVVDFALNREWFQIFLQGMQEELGERLIQTWDDLERYCYQVAGVVGLLSCQIFEDMGSQTFAEEWANALQIINVIRDFGEDLRRDRLYIPLQLIQVHQIDLTHLQNFRQWSAEDRLAFQPIFQAMAERARLHYRNALAALKPESLPKQRASLVMGAIYWDLLDVLEDMHFDVWDHRVSLTPMRKSWVAFKGYFNTFWGLPQRIRG